MIDFSSPGNSGPGDRDGDGREAMAELPPHNPQKPPSRWGMDLLILLAAALAAFGTFLYEAWQRSHPETLM